MIRIYIFCIEIKRYEWVIYWLAESVTGRSAAEVEPNAFSFCVLILSSLWIDASSSSVRTRELTKLSLSLHVFDCNAPPLCVSFECSQTREEVSQRQASHAPAVFHLEFL